MNHTSTSIKTNWLKILQYVREVCLILLLPLLSLGIVALLCVGLSIAILLYIALQTALFALPKLRQRLPINPWAESRLKRAAMHSFCDRSYMSCICVEKFKKAETLSLLCERDGKWRNMPCM